jgi:hypothetical protein
MTKAIGVSREELQELAAKKKGSIVIHRNSSSAGFLMFEGNRCCAVGTGGKVGKSLAS